MCLAVLFSLAGEGIIIAEICYGAGRHVVDPMLPVMDSQDMKIIVISG